MFTYRRILVPLDGSDLAERALIPGSMIAQALPATLILLHVVSTPLMSIDPQLHRQVAQQSEDEAYAYLHRRQVALSADGVEVAVVVLHGAAADMISQYAQENEVDLILISSHGRTGPGRWVYGSVAEKVLRGACCHTAVIRAQVETTTFSHRRILVPLDGSSLAEKALAPAFALAEALTAELLLLRVAAPAHLTVETDTMREQSEYLESHERADADSYLGRLMSDLPQTDVKVSARLVKGPTAEMIISSADKLQVDLIVMSSHGRSGIGRWLYGSVAEKVLRGADCATLVVRDNG